METPEIWFHRRATFYVECQILFHLNQVGVFALLSERGARTAAEIAAALRLSPGTTDALLDYVLEIDDLLERDQGGRYSLSEFGGKVVDRFSDLKSSAGPRSINMFDVRVGAYGPVWQNLGGLMTGVSRYGETFHRDGRYAESGVAKLAMRFWDSLIGQIEEFAPERVMELGLTTGLLERVAQTYPAKDCYGLDKSQVAIAAIEEIADAHRLTNVHGIQSDFFDIERWSTAIRAGGIGLIYSLHFHEMMARGESAFVEALRELRSRFPQWVMVAFEQPRLPHSEKANLSESLWLYAQSNILIHHLIGNGRILSRDAWMDLGHQAGCPRVTDQTCNYLGYRAIRYQF
jgi:hypothetical protein